VNDAYDLPLDPSDRTPWTVDLGGIHVVFGEGTLERLGAETAALGIRRALLVTDAGLEKAGHADRAIESLRRAGVAVRVYDGVEENPTTEHVGRGVAEAHAHGADGLIGLGGGSSMDCAKAVNFLFTNGRSMADYQGVDKATRPMLPSLGVPTTTGTGSEAQRFALISDPATHRKMACGDRKARFRTVVLDPELVSTMPRRVAATTAIDAVSHALESYVTRRRNPISQLYAREAWRLLESSFEAFLADPRDRRARGRMLLGAHLGGAAIEASMLGAAHSCANPLTARYGVTHGVAVGLMLPHVIRFNGAAVDELYGELAHAARLNGGGVTHAERVSARVGELLAAAGLPARLRDCGVDAERLDALAAEAAEQWTARFNPRAVAAGELRELYAAAY
jgi:alcohol dehydrogenase